MLAEKSFSDAKFKDSIQFVMPIFGREAVHLLRKMRHLVGPTIRFRINWTLTCGALEWDVTRVTADVLVMPLHVRVQSAADAE